MQDRLNVCCKICGAFCYPDDLCLECKKQRREDAQRAQKALDEYRAKGGHSLDEIKTELGLEK